MDNDIREILDTFKASCGMACAKIEQLNHTTHRQIKSNDLLRESNDRLSTAIERGQEARNGTGEPE